MVERQDIPTTTGNSTGRTPATARDPKPAGDVPATRRNIPATTGRVVIEDVTPIVDCGRFAVKRVVGDEVRVEADVFADGHDRVAAVVEFRAAGETAWQSAPMSPVENDRWEACFGLTEVGRYEYRVRGWIDHFATWRHGLEKKAEAGLDLVVDLVIGADLVSAAAGRASGPDKKALTGFADRLRDDTVPQGERVVIALDPAPAALAGAWPDRSDAAATDPLALEVDRPLARFSSWYELFPRSWGPAGEHGTLLDVAERIDYVADLGFDVLYLPPVSPIGTTKRKGPNNTLEPGPDDPGVPWAVGSAEGGHTAIHPDLGTLDDFRALRDAAAERGIELALDIAFQCSPDHPWVQEHPEWFRSRPDGTVQYAENPPKRYEDIYPIDFETSDPEGLWEALRDVFAHWIDHGVSVFRVDNPHTKAFAFWEWVIGDLKQRHPETIFLAEAFTRPKVMNRLAKLGFTQSYTYFTWRNTAWELGTYMEQLRETADFFRPNFWPNTPDILPQYLQADGRAAFVARAVLAATLSSNYGIYGPAFEHMDNVARSPGSEEYLDSEKYQIRHWDLDRPDSLAPVIRRLNAIRRDHPALQRTHNVAIHPLDNEMLFCFSRLWERDLVVVVVNLDPHHTQSGWVRLPLSELGIDEHQPFQMHDALTDRRFLWSGADNYVELSPQSIPAHVFSVRRRARTEHDFDYYL